MCAKQNLFPGKYLIFVEKFCMMMGTAVFVAAKFHKGVTTYD